ncbi:hypothetical protein HGRIS_013129 [Hohenbuehelia grisea]
MKAPDGSYEEGLIVPGVSNLSRNTKKVVRNLEHNNPLSLHNDNPWNEWFASVELRRTILQDVERTFPEMAYFRRPDVQNHLTNILFLYSVMNPLIGYRQGMHELLAPLYHAVDFDSIPEDTSLRTSEPDLTEICNRTWVGADAWSLFVVMMNGVSQWFEWREPPPGVSVTRPSPLASHVTLGPQKNTPFVAPIVHACNNIQSNFLRNVDPVLYDHMQSAGIEPQIYGIRWLRLLFTREFSMRDAMILWDGLFACDPTFELAQWVCVAMLLRIRNHLLSADYSGQLTVLLRYPSLPSPNPDFDGAPHHISLLLRQALAFQMAPTPSTGVSVVLENRNLLHIPSDVPEPETYSRPRRNAHQSREKSTSASPSSSQLLPGRSPHGRQPSSPQIGLPEMIARGLMERSENLGINKTFMNAVSELRKNIPDIAASLVRSPNLDSASLSSFPLTEERQPDERPPWEPRSRFEMEGEIAALKSTNKKLGESVSWIVDTLLQDETDVKDPKRLHLIQGHKREALESLSYVRDVLMGGVVDLEEDRLLGEDELKRRRSKQNGPTETAVQLPSPTPVPVIDSRPKLSNTGPFSPQSPRQPVGVASPTSAGPGPRSAIHATSPRVSAPWNYTRSNFSGEGNLPSAILPRLPPPTSTSLPRTASGGRQSTDQSPPLRQGPQHDPLGVLKSPR